LNSRCFTNAAIVPCEDFFFFPAGFLADEEDFAAVFFFVTPAPAEERRFVFAKALNSLL
jgi:hypothetical protein